MIIKKDQMSTEVRYAMRGGPGEVTITHLAKKEEMNHARLMAIIDIPAGSGIGEHEHLNETEYYIILQGEAVVKDDGIDKKVTAGDMVVTGDGASHNITNTGSGPLKMIALIILT